MLQKDKDTLELITLILGKLYELNVRGYYTAWLDWSGHTNGIYIKIIRGKWREGKKGTIICEPLVSTQAGRWRDGITGTPFDISGFLALVKTLSKYKPQVKTNHKIVRHEKA